MKPPLLTPRLRLEAYTEDRRAEFVELNTDAVVRERMNGPLTVEKAQALFDRIVMSKDDDASAAWAVVDIATGDYLGHLFLDAGTDEPDPELGFLLKPETWGRGFATEAVRRVLKFAEAETRHQAVHATADEGHAASIRVLEKCGFCLVESRIDEFGPFGLYRWKAGS